MTSSHPLNQLSIMAATGLMVQTLHYSMYYNCMMSAPTKLSNAAEKFIFVDKQHPLLETSAEVKFSVANDVVSCAIK